MPFSEVDFLQALAAGILVGSAYALMCIGLGIIFGSMNVINFAQGDFLMLGMYAAFYLTTGFGVLAFLGPYGGPIVAAFLAGPLVFGLGWLLHRFIVSRVTGAGVAQIEGAGAYGQILVTLGLSLILQNGGLIVFGSTPTGIRTPLSRSSWEIGDVLLNQGRCVSFVVAIALAAAVYLFLTHTRLGSILGAFRGGLLIGVVQQMSTLVLPYQLQNTTIFVVFLLIIFLRPQGIFGRLSERT